VVGGHAAERDDDEQLPSLGRVPWLPWHANTLPRTPLRPLDRQLGRRPAEVEFVPRRPTLDPAPSHALPANSLSQLVCWWVTAMRRRGGSPEYLVL
jgi:hypothetical protein